MTRVARISSGARRTWAADADLKDRQQHAGHGAGCWGLLGLSWACLGVIYGDLGTSPLYVYSTIFDKQQPSQEDVLCATSLIFWSITLVVLLKYVFVVLLADDNGEGGTFAMYATICRACGIPAVNSGAMPADKQLFEAASAANSVVGTPNTSMRQLAVSRSARAHPADHDCPVAAAATQELAAHDPHQEADIQAHAKPHKVQSPAPGTHPGPQPPKQLSGLGGFLRDQLSHNRVAQKVLLGCTLLMTAMVLGDGVLTPSISVLSAVSGLQVKAGLSSSAVIGITCAILVVLFAIQSWGTHQVGVLFAPTVALWFFSNVVVGIYNICMFEGGSIFRALSPHYIGVWFHNHGTEGWLNMAGVFLCLTGCEAMFADMGHFSRQSIQLSFVVCVYPSLILTYLGQASWLMHNLDGYAAVFYNSLPLPVFWPIFVVSVLASIVASQALITGAFSMVYQSMAMGCFPRFKVQHTSEDVGGQIFIPEVNYTLLVLCVAVVAGFQSSTAIGNAYGIAVNMVMLSTVFLVALVMLVAWGTHPLLVLLFLVPFSFIEGVFLSANILNIPYGGWFSITLAVILSAANTLWIWGTAEKSKALKREHFQISDLLTTKPPNWQKPGFGMATQSWRLYRVCNSAPLIRNPGMAIIYSESPFNVPAVFKRLVESWGVHSIVVFLTVRQVPIPHVSPHERLLLAALEFRGFYKCVARYGYMDKVDQGELFAQSILDKIAEVMPSHAMADIAVSQRASHDGSSSGSHDGAVAARALAHLPPSIAEEGESPAASLDGGKKPPTSQGCVGCQDGSIPSIGSLAGSTAGGGGIGTCGIGTGGASVSGSDGGPSVCDSDGGSKSHSEDRAVHTMDVQVHCGALDLKGPVPATAAHASGDEAAGAWGCQGDHVEQSGDGSGVWRQSSGGVELSIPTAAEPVIGLGPVTHRRTTWEARRTQEGAVAVSDIAAHAVYVLHRSIIHVRPRGSMVQARTRKFLIEVVYQQLWQLTTRFWEGWKVPAARMFEVGMVVEI